MKLATVLAFVLVLAGCASVGNEKADTFRERVSYAEASNAAVLDAVASSYAAGTIAADDARSIEVKADQVQVILVAAKNAYAAGDVAGAQSKLAIALTGLQALQDYLRTQGAHP